VHALERHVHLVHETFLLFLVVTGQAAVPITCAVSGKDGRDYSRTAFCLPIDQLPVRELCRALLCRIMECVSSK
jgi:hypothetical protein